MKSPLSWITEWIGYQAIKSVTHLHSSVNLSHFFMLLNIAANIIPLSVLRLRKQQGGSWKEARGEAEPSRHRANMPFNVFTRGPRCSINGPQGA